MTVATLNRLSGSTDETTRINNALVSAGAVLLQPGTWLVTTVLYPDGSSLSGAGPGQTILAQKSGTADFIIKPLDYPSAGHAHHKVTVRDLYLYGYNNQSVGLGGLLVEGVQDFLADNVRVEGVKGSAFKAQGHGTADSGDTMYGVFANCFVSNLVTGGKCFHFAPATGGGSHPDRWRIIGGSIGSNTRNCIGVYCEGPDVDAVGAKGADNLTVIGLTGQELDTPFDMVVSSARFIGCHFENVGHVMDAYVRAGTTNFPSLNNVFISNTYPANTLTFHDSGQRTQRIFDLDSTGLIHLMNVYSGNRIMKVRTYGETGIRFDVASDGTLEWGNGTDAVDSTLSRFQVRGLRTESEINTNRGSTGSVAFSANVGGVGNYWTILSDGKMQWAPGNGSVDTNLYRSAAALLKTDGNLVIAGMPTADPHVAGALWNSSGTVHISAG